MSTLNSPFNHLFLSPVKTFFICITIITLVINSGCNDSIVEPEPGRRDYQWTFETLDISGTQYFNVSCVWGTSAKNIRVAGSHMGKIILWHYNGESWQREDINSGGYPVQLWGDSRDNVFLLDIDGHIWKYSGSEWSAFSEIAPPEGFNEIIIYSMYRNSDNDIYFAGAVSTDQSGTKPYTGVIVHYINGKYIYMNIPEKEMLFSGIYKQKSTGSYFISGYYSAEEGIQSKIFKYDGENSLKEISSNHGLAELNGSVYFQDNQKLYTYNNGRLVLRKNFTGTSYLGGLTGRSENDFFCYDKYFNVLHYNGTDFKYIYDNVMLQQVANGLVFENDAFFVLKGVEGVVVLHGVLE